MKQDKGTRREGDKERGRSNAHLVVWPSPCLLVLLALAVPLAALTGCGVDFGYILPAVAGQAELILESVPVPEAIRSGGLSDAQKAKLILIRDVRAYADKVIGLNVANHYTTIYDTGGEPVAYNISASAKDQFRAKTWTFPLVGTIPYLGFFDQAAALAEKSELERSGYDVFMYPIDAYTGFQGIPNPVLSPMLGRDEIYLADLVFHELLHSTIWRMNDTTFNESLATFVGLAAREDFFRNERPEHPEWLTWSGDRTEDTQRYNDFIFGLYADLESFYAGDLSKQQKILEREAVYQAGRDYFMSQVHPQLRRPEEYEWVRELPTNNAFMLANYRYNFDLAIFAEVHAATGADWRQSLRVFAHSARAREPYAFLRAWLAGDPDARDAVAPIPLPPSLQKAQSPSQRGPCVYPHSAGVH